MVAFRSYKRKTSQLQTPMVQQLMGFSWIPLLVVGVVYIVYNSSSPAPNLVSETNDSKVESSKDDCFRIQKQTWSSSWNAVDDTSKQEWTDKNCGELLSNAPPLVAPPGEACGKPVPDDVKAISDKRIDELHDKYKGKKCVLIANGPSLNKISWDWQDNFDVIMGMNKIYIGFQRYNLTKLNLYAACNALVLEQAREHIWSGELMGNPQLDKFLGMKSTEIFPCESASRNIHFIKATDPGPFSTDLKKGITQGGTVTYWSLQVLHWVGCQEVYIVGMDHNFDQVGKPNEKHHMKHDDPNHFDPSYFKNNDWHNADIKANERSYKKAREQYETDGRKIYDATEGGKCDIFEKVDWKVALYPKKE